jgi:hypothetical protein
METTRSSGLARRAKKRLPGEEVTVAPWPKQEGTRKHVLFRISPCPVKTKLLDRLKRNSMLCKVGALYPTLEYL